jgi:hypothetical protein
MRDRPKDRFRESTQFCRPPRNLSGHFCRQPTCKPTDRLCDTRDSTSGRISVYSNFFLGQARFFFVSANFLEQIAYTLVQQTPQFPVLHYIKHIYPIFTIPPLLTALTKTRPPAIHVKELFCSVLPISERPLLFVKFPGISRLSFR